MKYKLFGRSGLRVSELCLGTMTFGDVHDWSSNKDESRKVFDTFVQAGGNFLDTANFYTKGTSEQYLGEWIAPNRDYYVVATKYTLATDPKNPNASGNSNKNLITSVEKSLKRLNTDYIDLLWLHAWDNMTPIDEIMRSLDALVRQGKVLYVGFSDAPAWLVSQGNTLADLRGWAPFVAVQLEYSLVQRSIEPEFFSMTEALDLAINAWSPLGMGLLTGKYTRSPGEGNHRFQVNDWWASVYMTEQRLAVAREVDAVADEVGATSSQVALAWMLRKKQQLFPIVGAKTSKQLKENLGALDVTLSDEQVKRLDAVSAIELPFPYNFLNQDSLKGILAGDFADRIENHHNVLQ